MLLAALVLLLARHELRPVEVAVLVLGEDHCQSDKLVIERHCSTTVPDTTRQAQLIAPPLHTDK